MLFFTNLLVSLVFTHKKDIFLALQSWHKVKRQITGYYQLQVGRSGSCGTRSKQRGLWAVAEAPSKARARLQRRRQV